MGANSDYNIPFKGLENGIHNYRYQISTDFFKKFENSRIAECNYAVELILDKRDHMMILDFSFNGEFRAICDLCLAMISIPSEGRDQIIVKIENEAKVNGEENVVMIDPDIHNLDISTFIYDVLHLHLPLKNERDCESDGYEHCDHTILDKIGSRENNENIGGSWDILKKLELD